MYVDLGQHYLTQYTLKPITHTYTRLHMFVVVALISLSLCLPKEIGPLVVFKVFVGLLEEADYLPDKQY